MRRIRPILSLLLVVLVAAWGDGLCRPALDASAHPATPCHGTSHGDSSADGAGDGSDDEAPAPVSPVRSCTVCPLCAPVAPSAVVAEDHHDAPTRVPGADLDRPADRPGPRPPVPPPEPVV